MTEPTTSGAVGLSALAIAMLGPMAGPYALIVFAALAGAMWPLSAQDTPSRWAGAWLLLRCTLTAVVLTGMAAALLERQFDLPSHDSLAPVAFVVGAMGNGWRPVFGALGAVLAALLQRRAGTDPTTGGQP